MHFLMPFCLKFFCGDHGEVLEGTSGRPRFSVANSKVHLKMRNAARPSSRRFAQEKVDRPRRLLFFCGQVGKVMHFLVPFCLKFFCGDHGEVLEGTSGRPRFSVANSKVHLKMRNAARPSSRRFAQEKVDRPRRLLFFCGQPA